MKRLKAKFFAAAFLLAFGAFSQLKAGGFCCLDNIKVGADWLYWEPCGTGMDYAVVAEDGDQVTFASDLRIKHIKSRWDSGVRAYAKIDKIWCNFNVGIAYTYYNAHSSSSVDTDTVASIILSNGIPNSGSEDEVLGNYASAHWRLKYQTFDAFISYLLNVSCDPCLEVEAFSGLKWVSMRQHRDDTLIGSLSASGEGGGDLYFDRHLNVCGVGPMLGVNTSYTFCDCIKAFGMIGASVIVAESKSRDHETIVETTSTVLVDQTFHSRDECVCFPGVHLMTGVTYETCFCNMEVGLRLGWEYVQYINAPDFPSYEFGDNGIRSSVSEKNLSMQGIFLGANISF